MGQLRLIRAIKPFKIARLMKLGKSAAVITVLMDFYEISPKQGASPSSPTELNPSRTLTPNRSSHTP